MRLKMSKIRLILLGVISLTILTGIPASVVLAQDFPNKPITLYVGFAAGATTDIVGRALAAGVEKVLGVPVLVEQKAGASSTVCAGLVASKKPDGYTLGIVSSDAIMRLPDLIKVPYNPMTDFSYVGQYAGYSGALVVSADSPHKTAEEFIAYAKAHPGMTYASNGINNQQAMSIEVLAQCKGLKFKAIPYTGGSEAITSMLGKHVDFLCGAGSHLPYVQQGKFRMLIVTQTDKRDPEYPNVPTLKELGCPDVPPNTQIIIAPKGMPDAIGNKLAEAFKKVADGPEFQQILKQIKSPYLFKSRQQLEKDLHAEFELYKDYHKKTGTKRNF
ncbi:MAG: tripartite tricarboxylate transporter substrate binding protein [Deltaproteobacteria bacterium]|nr:tripartite tricarboxylate transporter substrate binding protein [Deltaproteobacteria bacterium]